MLVLHDLRRLLQICGGARGVVSSKRSMCVGSLKASVGYNLLTNEFDIAKAENFLYYVVIWLIPPLSKIPPIVVPSQNEPFADTCTILEYLETVLLKDCQGQYHLVGRTGCNNFFMSVEQKAAT